MKFQRIFHIQQNQLHFQLYLNSSEFLHIIVTKLRSLFDLDAPIEQIDQHLHEQVGAFIIYQEGLRVPGIWGTFEAGIRAILGQQVSVLAAKKLVTDFVNQLGQEIVLSDGSIKRLFPTAQVTMNTTANGIHVTSAGGLDLHIVGPTSTVGYDLSVDGNGDVVIA